MKKIKDSKPPQICVAIIDERGIYMGVQMIAANHKTDAHVEVPVDCDLAINKYRWHADRQTFIADPVLTIGNRKKMKRGE